MVSTSRKRAGRHATVRFGADTLVIVAALWYVGRMSGTVAGAVTAAVLLVFSLWGTVRWLRRRLTVPSERGSDQRTNGTEGSGPLDRLKQRYANGELSDAEFEERLDTLLDADRRAESTNVRSTPRPEQLRESE